MAGAREAVPPELVGDLVAAVRKELNYWIPRILTPLVEELTDLRNQHSPEKDNGRDNVSFSPTADKKPSGFPSSVDPAHPVAFRTSEGSAGAAVARVTATNEVGCADSAAGGQEVKAEKAASMNGSAPMQMEIAMSTSLVAPAATPREVLLTYSWRNLWGWKTSARDGYHVTPRCDDEAEEPEPVTYSNMMDEDDGPELTDPEAARRLPGQIAGLEDQITEAAEKLEDLNVLWKNRKTPYEEDITNFRKEIESLQEELEIARMPKVQEAPPPGPAALKFVDSGAFSAICNLVVLLNLSAMFAAPKYKSYAAMFNVLDHVFLTWYVVELSLKAIYHQRNLILGKISVVWWNWLDLLIVVSGVIDQWLMPLLEMLEGGQLDINVSALRLLRLLRLFRIMRFLKIIKAFLMSDFAWTEGALFESLMAGVIGFNSVVMSMELDIPWVGWFYVENFLQVTYSFELLCRLKRAGCAFFFDQDNMMWNNLDFIMVGGGALDLWLVPGIFALQGLFTGKAVQEGANPLSEGLKILKIMRILRVLRLVRLLKMVHPLYRLLMGVIASIKAMQWVMVLTLLTLYACSIVFTNLVGKGLMGGEVSGSAFEYFGSVPKSLFSLFKLMNGDTSVVAPITGSVVGQLLFAGFMVVSNWAILAVLTAVVSDNMINSSQKANEEDERVLRELDHQKRLRRLTTLFKQIDRDGEGSLSTSEWQRMLEDRSLQRELCDASGLTLEDLDDYFDCLAKDPKQLKREKQAQSEPEAQEELHLDYQTFMEALKDEGVLADKRSILHVMKQLRVLESNVKSEFDELAASTGMPKTRRSMLRGSRV